MAQWRQRLSTTSDWSRQGVVAGLACVGYKALVHENKEAASLQVSSSSPCPVGAGSVVQLCPGCVTHWGQCHGVRSSALTRITGLGTKGYKIAPKCPIGLRLGDAAPRLPFWGRRLPPGLLWLLGSSCSSSSGCPRAIGHLLHHLSCDSALGPPGQVLSAWELQTLSVSNEPSSWRHISIPLLPILVDTRHHSTRNWEDVLKYCHSLHVKSRVPFCFAYRMLRNVSSLRINGHFLFLFTGHEGSYSLIQLLSSFSL